MNRAEVRELAARYRNEVIAGDVEGALAALHPLVAGRTPFPLLDLARRPSRP